MKKKNDECEEFKERLKECQIQMLAKEKKLSKDISALRAEVQKLKG